MSDNRETVRKDMEGSEELQVMYQGQGQVLGTTHYFL